jgi:transcriptional regulator with XRE-family HTH domain
VSEGVPPDPVALGMAIRLVRRRLKKPQRVVAEASGIHLTTFKEIEKGIVSRDRRPGTLEGIAATLGVTLEQLYELANNPVTPKALEDPTLQMLEEIGEKLDALEGMREEIGEKFSALEKHLGKIDAYQMRQHDDLVQRIDVLYRHVNPPKVKIDLSDYRHSQDAPGE